MTNYSKKDKAFLIAFGLRIQAERSRKGFSQEDLAEAANLHRTYIGSAERGERNVSLLNIYKIANALDIPVSALLTDD